MTVGSRFGDAKSLVRAGAAAILVAASFVAVAAPPEARAATTHPPDFNGDGHADLAVGVVGENGLTGAVNVIYGSASGLSTTTAPLPQLFTQDSVNVPEVAEGGDAFGGSLAWGDFNGDAFDDLAVGVPGENSDAGAVNVIYGSASGLSTTTAPLPQLFTQDSVNVPEVAEGGDSFGWALAAGDFNGDARDDLAVGVPFENGFAGAVNVIYGSAS